MRSRLTLAARIAPLGVAFALFASRASAHPRARFEPTDLELQPAGTFELDAQLSYTQGATAGRVIVPDVEASIGIASNVQLEIDTAYAVEGPPNARFSFDHPAPDNVWIASKIGLVDDDDDDNRGAWAFGVQLGPKLPLAPDARGGGFETLFLLSRTRGPWQTTLNLGGLVDPSSDGTLRRTTGIEGGFDVVLDLDGPLSLLSEIGGVRFFSGEGTQTHATFGVMWAVNPNLDLSAMALIGFFGNGSGDRGGILLGVTPRIALWK